MILDGVREYAEGYKVELKEGADHDAVNDREKESSGVGRLMIVATNEGGYNCTEVDLIDLLDWVKLNMPELLKDKP